ncbi:MAG: hypothetical protein LBK27_00350 [Treponema sp.]|nr:hypothetical protein [Treponema sp.]
MRLKSFLFLITALAMGLALAGCSSDSGGEGYPVPGPKEGYLYSGVLTDAQKIMLSFQDAPAVYLEDETDLSDGVVIIPDGKTLHVNGQTVKVNLNTVIVVTSNGKLDWDNKPTSILEGTSAVVIGKTYEDGRYSAGSYGVDGNTFGINFGEIGKNKYAGSESVGWHTAATKYDDLVIGASGTTGYFLGNLSESGNVTPAGTLVVGGNLALSTDKVITSAAPIYVYGNLKGGTDASQTLITGTVSAISAEISGGKIANDFTILRDGKFSEKTVTFEGALNVRRDASFDEVKFEGVAAVAKQATFTSDKKVAGSVTVGNLKISGTGGNQNLVLDQNGQIIYNNGVTGSFLTGAGTLATLDGGSITLTLASNKLTIDGKGAVGSFAVQNNIDLTGENTIEVKGSAAVKFEAGTIVASTYKLGGTIDAVTSNEGFILTKDSIKKRTDTTGTPTIILGTANGILLRLNEDSSSTAIIDGVNIDLSSGGSIGVYEGNLIITGGGSVTTSATAKIAWGGTIAGSAAGGSLLVGSIAVPGGTTAEGIAAGSVGTHSSALVGVIVSNDGFITTSASVAQGTEGAGKFADGGSATTAGSILVFGHNN